jgi:hypothetical protein
MVVGESEIDMTATKGLHISDDLWLPLSTVVARLNANTNKTEGCWLWTGYLKNGYGFTEFSTVGVYAHRLSHLLNIGPLENGMEVLHRCDVPACLRPDHLFKGTQPDNIKDMWDKGRASKPPVHWGLSNSNATLTDKQVDELRRMKGKQRDVAKHFGVSQATVWRLRHRLTRRTA